MDSKEQVKDEVHASCGKAEVDEIKLQKCTCCQDNHRPQHKEACKQRVAEISDDKLLSQPDGTHLGECPLCCLPMPLEMNKSTLNSCCCKRICDGCDWANKKREIEQGLEHKCPYCREPLPATQEECDQNIMKRVKANDPVAICQMGKKRRGKGDYEGAFEYHTKAAALGDMGAHYELSVMYKLGDGVEKDIKKEMYHLEEAAIGGHPNARYNLGCHEGNAGRIERAMKHFIIAANLGYDSALDAVKEVFMDGTASKDEYAAALRGHQAAVDATKSKQREEAYASSCLRRWS